MEGDYMHIKKVNLILVLLLCCLSNLYAGFGDSLSYYSEYEYYYKGTKESTIENFNSFFDFLSQTHTVGGLRFRTDRYIRQFRRHTSIVFECRIDNTFSFSLTISNDENMFFDKENIKEFKITYTFSYFPPNEENIKWPDYKGQVLRIENAFELYAEEQGWELEKNYRGQKRQ
jgi:hypothetical protein